VLFVHGDANRYYSGESVFAFISKVEEIIKLNQRTRSGPTQRNYISWFEVSPFWVSEPMRRSLFTVLLRGGLCYNIRGLADGAQSGDRYFTYAIRQQKYLRDTEVALKRFLAGYTHFTGRVTRGWYDTFGYRYRRIFVDNHYVWRHCHPPIEALEKMLVKPERKEIE
jgi:hypothetical protein